MGRTLEFALSTMLITVVEVTFAFFVVNAVGNKITGLFNQITEALPSGTGGRP